MADAGGEAPMAAKTEAAPSVRVVRCPKCGKYLPEMQDFKVYRCGGCGAILKAKRSIQKNMVSSEKSDGVNVAVYSEKSDGNGLVTSEEAGMSSSKKEMPPDGNPEAEPGSSKGNSENGEISPDRIRESNESPSSMLGLNGNRMFKPYDISKHDYLSEESRTSCRESSYRHPSKAPFHNSEPNLDETSKIYSPMRRENKHQRVQTVEETVLQSDNEEGASGSQRGPRGSAQGMEFSTYCDGGMSNSQPNSMHSRDHRKQNVPDRAKNLEDTAELLKTLDLIREHLSRSYGVQVSDSETERAPRNEIQVPTRPYTCHCHRFPEGQSSIDPSSYPYFHSINGNGPESQNYRSKLHVHNDIFGYRGPPGPWALRQSSYQDSTQYLQRPYLNHAYEQVGASVAMPHVDEAFYRQPTCKCQMPPRALSSGFKKSSGSYHVDAVDNPRFPLAGSYNSTTTNSSLLFQQPIYQQRSAPRNRCEPFAGGAPFIACQYCFNMLQVPPTTLSNAKERKKVQCGSCFQVITFQITGKKLVVPAPPMTTASSKPSNTANGTLGSPQSDVEGDSVLSDSRFKNNGRAGYNTRSEDEKIPALSSHSRSPANWVMKNVRYLGLSESENTETEGELSRSSDGTAYEEIPHAAIYKKEVENSSELPKSSEINAYIPTLPASGPYSPLSNHSVSSPEMSTEMNLQVNGHTNLDFPQDLIRVNKEEKFDMVGDSLFAGPNQLLAKEKINVSVNGHPIPHRLVKKAENRAGPIQPGKYWYDYHAGFWGVMDEPCMGIIPPFIEEFNYPMPKKCSAGNTAVLVNGRELNHKDLQLLVDRGLPKSSGRSYVIDICGRVTDAMSGEELDGLGKLAPTIEMLKRGFGMKQP